jgi:hypothetical protein
MGKGQQEDGFRVVEAKKIVERPRGSVVVALFIFGGK